MAGNQGSGSAGRRSMARRRWAVASVVLALTVGFSGGYALHAISAPPRTHPPAASTSPPVVSPPPTPTDVPCSAAADAGRELIPRMHRAAEAIGNLDPRALQQVLDEIEQIQARLEEAVRECQRACVEAGP